MELRRGGSAAEAAARPAGSTEHLPGQVLRAQLKPRTVSPLGPYCQLQQRSTLPLLKPSSDFAVKRCSETWKDYR